MTPARRKTDMKEWAIQTTITTLSAIVISMSGFWMIEGRNFVGREEMSKMLHEEINKSVKDNPYLFDKSGINELLNNLKQEDILKLQKIEELSKNIADIKIQLAQIQIQISKTQSKKGE